MVYVSASHPPRRGVLRIAMLNADTTTPNTYAHMGTFGDILHHVLTAAACRIAPQVTLKHTVFDVVKGEYPSYAEEFDAFIITASAASAVNESNEPWIQRLEEYVVLLHEQHSQARLFGSCFGHHIICQALLKQHGLRVEKHPRGWEIGVGDVYFTQDFKEAFNSCESEKTTTSRDAMQTYGRLPSPEAECEDGALPASTYRIPPSMRLQFVHEDQVVLGSPTSRLPDPWTILGSTEHCAVQGVYKSGRVMTLQGHFEFDKFENRETMRIFGADDELMDEGQGEFAVSYNADCGHKGRAEDDGETMAEMVLRFLMMPQNKRTEGAGQADTADTGLLTPRSSFDI